MKKLLALLLALVLALSLVACAEEEETSIRRSKKDREETTEATEEETEPEETEEETQEETEEETQEETEPEEEEAEPFGTIDGQIYENAYFGFGVELDRTWVIATEEEAAEMMGMGAEVMGIDEQLTAGTYCDLYAMTAAGTTVNIGLQKDSLLTRVYTDEEFLQAAEVTAVAQFEKAGMTDIKTEIISVTFAGKSCTALSLQGTMYGVTIYETAVLWRTDGYLALITAASRDAAGSIETLELFYSLDEAEI